MLRRSIRAPALISLAVLILWYSGFASSFGLATQLRLRAPQPGRRAVAWPNGADGRAHPFDAFAKGFPELRGPGARGVPADALAGSARGTVFEWMNVDKMFVFGDSYSTLESVGEIDKKLESTHYRQTGIDGGHPDQLHGKATDIKWCDYLYAMFHDFHAIQYYNFAGNGAVIDPDVIPPHPTYTSFKEEVQDFQDLFIPRPWNVPWHGNDSLFIIQFGGNDIGRMNRNDLGRLDVESTTAKLAAAFVAQCRRLHSLGARFFLILNLPPIHLSPKYNLPREVGFDSHDLVEQSVDAFNRHLAAGVEAWREEEADATIMLYDLHAYWRLVLGYPEVFGLTDTTRYKMVRDGAELNPGRVGLAFHDNLHISWSAAELVARSIHGFLLRHSRSFHTAEATEHELIF